MSWLSMSGGPSEGEEVIMQSISPPATPSKAGISDDDDDYDDEDSVERNDDDVDNDDDNTKCHLTSWHW